MGRNKEAFQKLNRGAQEELSKITCQKRSVQSSRASLNRTSWSQAFDTPSSPPASLPRLFDPDSREGPLSFGSPSAPPEGSAVPPGTARGGSSPSKDQSIASASFRLLSRTCFTMSCTTREHVSTCTASTAHGLVPQQYTWACLASNVWACIGALCPACLVKTRDAHPT